jgi:uncharacterized protein (DUF433 family)
MTRSPYRMPMSSPCEARCNHCVRLLRALVGDSVVMKTMVRRSNVLPSLLPLGHVGIGALSAGIRLRKSLGNGDYFQYCNFRPDKLCSLAMNRIEIHPDVCNGQPVVRGTRITVQTILEYLESGDSVQEVLLGYPSLKREDVLACLGYARKLSKTHSTVQTVA